MFIRILLHLALTYDTLNTVTFSDSVSMQT